MQLSSPLRLAILYLLLLCICAGLGYPILGRYDPTTIDGTSDTAIYAKVIQGEAGMHGRNSYRVLQPLIGRAIYVALPQRVGPWPAVSVALLVSSAVFTAGSGVLVYLLALRFTRPALALIAALLYLLNFWVANSQLTGLVDASEAFLLTLVVLAMLHRQWLWLPVIGLAGGLAKETFVVLSAAMALGWLIGMQREGWRPWIAAAFMPVAGLVGVMALRLVIDGDVVWPWQLAAQQHSDAGLIEAMRGLLFDPGFYYGFVWLLPLAVWQLHRLPRPWLVGGAVSAAVTVLLGIYHDAGGANVARPLFSLLGSGLCIAAAFTLAKLLGERDQAGTATA